MKFSEEEIEYSIKGEIYSVERLEDYAVYLARELEVSDDPKITQPLLPRMRDNGKKLLASYRAFSEAIHSKETIPPAAEWLTDNFHIVEEQLREIQEDLPVSFYKELPKIAVGELAGYPRIYAVSLALVAHTDSQLEPETIRRFVQSYQQVSPLSIGELWALAITLRLVLVENLRRLAVRTLADHKKRNLANQIADEIFEGISDKNKSEKLIQKISSSCGGHIQTECAYFAQLAKRFRDQEAEIWPALDFLEKHLLERDCSTEQAVHLSHQCQASNQVSVANIITSMRLVSSLNWQEFFESLSLVDRILERDPIYGKMDFLTRDRYRHVVERIGKKTGVSQTEIAEAVIHLAQKPSSDSQGNAKSSHIGYYLIDKGLPRLAKIFNYKMGSIFDLSHSHKNITYFGILILFFAAVLALPVGYLIFLGISFPTILGVGCLVSIPASDLALSLTNLVLTHLIPPKNLPKLDLSTGVPENARAIVVIPCLLTDVKVIRDLIDKLEIHYLGNPEKEIFFGLLTDFTDSGSESQPSDSEFVEAAMDGIDRLNQKYASRGEDRFFLFHRNRRWNSSENIWMGWERKRGKLHEFNRLLRGAQDTGFAIATAPSDLLPTIRFVITLDADTQLPRDSAQKLIGTILHPLNRPVFDKDLGRVTEGYGVLQPRMGISLESFSRSRFSKIFSGYTGIDPYTTAVSEVYQDLFHEGCFAGKGLYDVDAFEAALDNRVPENTVLSHDLFEGLFARAALLTDVELLDDYPQSYRAFFTRQHRWVRGDWQISPWILPFVQNGKKQWVRNRLPLISRWKIFDNLRRSLVAPTTFLLLILGFGFLPGSILTWTVYTLTLIVFPALAQAIIGGIKARFGKSSFRISPSGIQTKNSFLQIFVYFTFLAHQAVIHLDAIGRVFYRKLISHSKLLEWSTAAQAERENSLKRHPIWQSFWPTEFGLIAVGILGMTSLPRYELVAFSFILIWMSYPMAARWLSRSLIKKGRHLSHDERLLLRQIARRTWHYFEKFVGPDDNWLPPDNHQIFPVPVTAHRTSPTNIGLYMLSLMTARDFGYLSTAKFIRRLKLTLATMEKLELHEGHYLNWYDTHSLVALSPKYVSTVDSGNLAGYLIAVREACLEVGSSFVVDSKVIQGLEDSVRVIEAELAAVENKRSDLNPRLETIKAAVMGPTPDKFSSWMQLFSSIQEEFEAFRKELEQSNDVSILVDGCLHQLAEVKKDIGILAPWLASEFAQAAELISKDEEMANRWNQIINALDSNTSFADLIENYRAAIIQLNKPKGSFNNSSSIGVLLSKFSGLLEASIAHVQSLLNEAQTAAQFMDRKFREMNFEFLLEKDREVFTIGYNVSEGKFDTGLYDLLGSESRLASFIAIAKGDIKQEHWFRLGRQLVPTASGQALVSWTASMFEYLMPMLVLRSYENTLLNETVHSVIDRQIRYGNERHVAWGISEAGYNARDLQLNYQYGPFGIPGLGLKRGLSHDLVISPYSTLLAAQVDPGAAIQNLKRLIKEKLLTNFGFFESVDYTPERLPENEKFAIVKSFMAHHQGMSLVSINNVIHQNIVQDRFHRDPRVRATQLLLQERVPQGVALAPPKASEVELETQFQPSAHSLIKHYSNPDSSTPRIHLLSNQNYSIMISTAGGGYSKCDDLAVTRWKEDATRDNSGSFIFVRDLTEDKIWSTSYLPLANLPASYKVSFGEEKVEFRRRDQDISTYTQILVAPEDNVEIRYVTLTNHSDEPHVLELTSYLEPVLGLPNNDLDHLTFSKLFIQTEFVSSRNALLAKRRKRSAQDLECWGLHVVVTDGEMLSDIQYETDRAKFIGRGRTLQNSLALSDDGVLSNTSGATIDPILSLRVHVRVPANGSLRVAFTTGLATSREMALELADRYHDIHAFDRESKLAWMQAQVDLRHLNVDSQTAYLYQRLAERILYSEPSLRPPTHLRAANTNRQSSLWPSGIGGDLPIVVVRISDQKDIAVIRKLLRCHEYLRFKGLSYDFVIINDHEASYHQDLQAELLQQIRATGSQSWLNKNGGIFILRREITPDKDIAHIQSVARVSLTASEPLNEQVNRRAIEEKYPGLASFPKIHKIETPIRAPNLPLKYFNGVGGFSDDGREYVILLNGNQWTPAPWINVIGNRHGFGFQVSESGSGFTWSLNSQSNRLTPWSNDPVSDPSGEIIYLRDDETGEIWTPTPLPIRSQNAYTIRHGQGYTFFEHVGHGIEHSLKLFVPMEDPVKISLLKIRNQTSRKRKLSIISYTEWVLGTRKEKTSPYLICDVDKDSGAIFAKNPHDNEFSSQVSFADLSEVRRTFTCSRKEFIGRNGNYADPVGLKRMGLSQRRGTGQDPCAVLQTSIELQAGEEFEISFLLGQCENENLARELALRYRKLDVVKSALKEAIRFWADLNETVQVKTPEPTMDLLMNRWLLYQSLSCRYWSRTAFYQSGGAYGFRDQLQDCMAFVYAAPSIAREHILRASQHQFKEGDVQHWWHPPTGRGIRTKMSDDLLWLPFVVSFYINITGDKTILDEVTPFIEAPLLQAAEEDSYTLPSISSESATIFEHCRRAIDRSLSLGQHDLPLMGTGDWNDGMNRVGILGQGESVWLAWFLYKVLEDFVPLCDRPGSSGDRAIFESHMKKLKVAVEQNAWDGEWYKRAFFDDGSSLGSSLNEECRIDSISQTWAVLSNAGDPDRIKLAMEKVEEFLVQKKSQLILLLTPPFDKTQRDPGYIKGYVPGVRENGGQYSHAAAWVVMAYAKLGQGDKAVEMFNMMNPISHSQDPSQTNRYKIEPYVLAGDVYGGKPHEGRGGWSWYTGSAPWYYRAGLESILGFKLRGNKLQIEPCIPSDWKAYEISYLHGKTKYHIQVKNPLGLNTGLSVIELDGSLLEVSELELADDEKPHQVTVTLKRS